MLVLNVEWNDPNLPQAFKGSSTKSENNYKRPGYKDTKSDSILIIALVESGMENWAGPMTGCLIAVVISTANTALYVASRTLYGLTMSDSFEKQHPILAKLSKTTPPAEKNGNRASWWTPWRYVGGNVPLWAVPVSAAALCFVPLRQLISGDSIQTVSFVFVSSYYDH
jgi:amino acid transporter